MTFRPRGIAILMVIVVLAGLLALAAPFVFSMVLQARAARGNLDALRAREGAEAASAHALAQLHKNTLKYSAADTIAATTNDNSPDVTTLQDLKVDMEFTGAKEFNKLGVDVKNPGGQLWSARVEDEQGKINVNTAPPALIGNLLASAVLRDTTEKGSTMLTVNDAKQFDPNGGIVILSGEPAPLRYNNASGTSIVLADATAWKHSEGDLVYDARARAIADFKFKGAAGFRPFRSIYEIKTAAASSGIELSADEFARMERHVTAQSGLAGPLWGHGAQPVEQVFKSTLLGFSIERGDGFTRGGLIRVMQAGAAAGYGRIKSVAPQRDGTAVVALEDQIGVDVSGGIGNEVTIEPELHNPVDINTATRDAIQACVMGVCLASSHECINRATASLLADHLTSATTPYATPTDLGKALDRAREMGMLTPQQRDAVYINATEPNSPKLKTSTVTFCFHSFGSYTIEASGVMNTDNGSQLARHTTRELVTLPTPLPGRFKVEFQAGFQDLLDQGEGAHVVTFPVALGPQKFRKIAPTTRVASLYSGDIRLDVGDSAPQGLPGEFIDHCEDQNNAAYRQDGYDMNKRKAWVLPPAVGNVGRVAVQPTAMELWFKPKGGGQCTFFDEGLEDERNRVTFAYEPSKGLTVKVYDAGLECTDVNQANFSHLRRNPVEYIYPAQLDRNEWYHIAGSWRTGRPGGQEARLDAQPAPKPNQNTGTDQIQFKPGVRLQSDLTLDEVDTITLEDSSSSDFPKSGAVQIGEEIIEYKTGSGTTLSTLTRGARLSCAVKHSSGEWVMPFGYSNDLAEDLPMGNSTLVNRMEAASATRTNISHFQMQGGKPVPYLQSEVKEFKVSDTSNFPPSGFIVVEGELIYYTRKTATAFQQLLRAQSSNTSGPARNIHNGSGVELASFEISSQGDYDTDRIVQIIDDTNDKTVEWIRYYNIQNVNGKVYVVAHLGANSGYINTGFPEIRSQQMVPHIYINGFRSWFGIGKNSAHDKKAKVIPVVRMRGPHCGNQLSPYGDAGISELSVLERGATHGDLRFVKQAYINQFANWHYTGINNTCPAKFDNWGMDFFAGLDDFVGHRYHAGNSRMLKWPSGELPDAINAQRYVGSDRNGEGMLNGYVNEVKVNTLQTRGARIAMKTDAMGITGGNTDILIETHDDWPVNGDHDANPGWPATGGLVRIEDELIYYGTSAVESVEYYSDVLPTLKLKAARTWTNVCPPNTVEDHPNIHNKRVMHLNQVTRGALGSKAVEHPVGAPAIIYDGMPVSVLQGPLIADGDTFTVKNAAGFPPEGYAWIGNEVVSWQKLNGTTFSGCKNFHGRYGTSPEDHETLDIVRCLPFRYWDRETKVYDGTGLAYIQGGYAATNAIWDNVQLRVVGADDQIKPTSVRPRVLVRFNGKPNWDADPSNKEGGLYEFRSKEGIMGLNGLMGRGVRADQIELRVYWQFLSGAFNKGLGTDWKRTFGLEMMRAAYSTPLIMRRLDEIEKR